jgi:hypothetical protein
MKIDELLEQPEAVLSLDFTGSLCAGADLRGPPLVAARSTFRRSEQAAWSAVKAGKCEDAAFAVMGMCGVAVIIVSFSRVVL